MSITEKPIRVSDVLSDPSISIETSRATKGEDIIGFGWMSSNTQVQPGFFAFAGHYRSHEDYTISAQQPRGVHIGFYLGDGYRSNFGGRELQVPSGYCDLTPADEVTPIKLYRGENRQQSRCELWLDADWIESASVERLDETGAIRNILALRREQRSMRASPALISAGTRMFAQQNWDGSLARLNRESAALSFLAAALDQFGETEIVRTSPNVSRIMSVRETLDALIPTSDVSLVQLAAQHGMSVRTLSRQFRLTFGTTVLQYLTERRMEQARIALEEGGITVDEAAYIAGFAHRTNFSSAFRQRYGFSPNELRGPERSGVTTRNRLA